MKDTLTTIEIFKSANITNVDRSNKTVTASGLDSVTGTPRRRTFDYLNDATLDKAEKFFAEKTTLVIEVDSSTKNIDFRSFQESQDKPSNLPRATNHHPSATIIRHSGLK